MSFQKIYNLLRILACSEKNRFKTSAGQKTITYFFPVPNIFKYNDKQRRYSLLYTSEIKMDTIEARAVIKYLIKGKEENRQRKFTRDWLKCMTVHAHH